MRIAIANTYRNRVGGVEAYLDALLPALAHAGHQIAFWHELVSADHDQITLPPGTRSWSAAQAGLDGSLDAMREWRPEIVFVNGLSIPNLERRLADRGPAVRFAHAYAGTCISGNKMFARPRARPCDRRFGPRCILHFYPHRCGGLDPLQMGRLYLGERERLAAFGSYSAIVTASNHMRTEYLKHGLERVSVVGLPIQSAIEPARHVDVEAAGARGFQIPRARDARAEIGAIRLLFAGRMTPLKGGDMMIDALPIVQRALGRKVEAVFAGDGPARAVWEARARRVAAHDHEISIEFTGWLERAALDSLMADADLLVVPSLWPEPFGLVGLEAGLNRLPAVAFAVGGIPEWLGDGCNGRLANANPPAAAGLADAIAACVRDPGTLERMREGARAVAENHTMRSHLAALLEVFRDAIARAHRDG